MAQPARAAPPAAPNTSYFHNLTRKRAGVLLALVTAVALVGMAAFVISMVRISATDASIKHARGLKLRAEVDVLKGKINELDLKLQGPLSDHELIKTMQDRTDLAARLTDCEQLRDAYFQTAVYLEDLGRSVHYPMISVQGLFGILGIALGAFGFSEYRRHQQLRAKLIEDHRCKAECVNGG